MAQHYLFALEPTIRYSEGTLLRLPFLINKEKEATQIVEKCVEYSRNDWDSFETSWDFIEHPLVRLAKGLWDATAVGASMSYYYGGHPKVGSPLELCYMLWQGECNERFKQLKANEEELNRIFIDIYGLQDELTPEVEDMPGAWKPFISYKSGNIIAFIDNLIRKLTPIQMPHVDIEELKQGRKAFTKEEWMSVLLRSIGMEPDTLSEREKWLLIARMLPLVENNFNLCELGPRSTGKSHLFKEISPNSILVSGGQTTVANLFYNMGRKTVGLVGLWDCVAFDEVAGINFKDKDGIQIMKDYMASGSFARGKEEKAATASMVFVGNINQSVDVLLKTSSLFAPFPPEMGTDTAFLDRMHCYIPGWEIPKFRPHHFTNDYGFITDYLAEFIRELRKEQYGDALDKYFRLGKNLNQRDTIAVRKMVGGFIKLLYPDGEYSKEQLEEILQISLEMRRRVKEQLKKLGGMEFYDVNFSYIDNETFEEHYVSVPEQGGGKLIPEGMCNPGQVYTVAQGKSGMLGVFRLESQMMAGNGKFERSGLGSDSKCKEATNTAFNFLKANSNRISGSISTTTKDYIVNYQDLQGIGMTEKLALPTLIALSSVALGKPTASSLAVLGEISIAGTLIKVDELANCLQVCLDSGAKKVLLPITSAADLSTVPAELIGCFNLIFYSSAEDAVYKALGVE